MLGLFKARAQLQAVSEVVDTIMPHILDDDPATRVSRALGELRSQVVEARWECERIRHQYEPNSKRVVLAGGITMVQPTGATRSQ